MPSSDLHFSHLPPGSREEVFERLKSAIDQMAAPTPSAGQDSYWKFFVFHRLEFERWAFHNGLDDYYFSGVEACLQSALKELGTIARVALLDRRVQIEVVPLDGGDYPTWACPVRSHEWIRKQLEVRPATGILLLLSQPAIERLPREAVMADLRHELGHVLLYLRNPEAIDDCSAADEEWERGTEMEDFIG
jgi:hypothetical protein